VIRILLADDHAVVRRGLRLVLEAEPDLRVVAEVGNGFEAVTRAMHGDVDLAVLDVSMPGMGGLAAAYELGRRRPDLRMLMLSMHANDQYFKEALRVGAGGYVLKSVADHDLIDACRAVMRGERFIHPDTERVPHASGESAEGPRLSPREAEILTLIAEGHSVPTIARMLVISPRTVDRHRENLFAKLHLNSRVELTRYAIRRGLIEP
jgi:DNA-binding NarL/FixJ family response regulator